MQSRELRVNLGNPLQLLWAVASLPVLLSLAATAQGHAVPVGRPDARALNNQLRDATHALSLDAMLAAYAGDLGVDALEVGQLLGGIYPVVVVRRPGKPLPGSAEPREPPLPLLTLVADQSRLYGVPALDQRPGFAITGGEFVADGHPWPPGLSADLARIFGGCT